AAAHAHGGNAGRGGTGAVRGPGGGRGEREGGRLHRRWGGGRRGSALGGCRGEQVLSVMPRALGPRVGAQVQNVIKAVKAGDWSLVDGRPVAAGVALEDGEYELKLVAADAEHSVPLPGGEGVVVLDTTVTPELAAEGLARDVVRVVQS